MNINTLIASRLDDIGLPQDDSLFRAEDILGFLDRGACLYFKTDKTGFELAVLPTNGRSIMKLIERSA